MFAQIGCTKVCIVHIILAIAALPAKRIQYLGTAKYIVTAVSLYSIARKQTSVVVVVLCSSARLYHYAGICMCSSAML